MRLYDRLLCGGCGKGGCGASSGGRKPGAGGASDTEGNPFDADAGGLPEGLFTPLVKTLGIALVSRLGGEICRDAGQGAMAAVLDTAGAFGAVLVSLPLVRAAWELLRTLV